MEKIRKYGLIGQSLEHSFSKNYFEKKFKKEEITASYENFEFDNLDSCREELTSAKLSGFNVTIPHKEAIIPYLDELEDSAAAIKAVNTVKIEGDKWIGYNTDVYGFKQSIKPYLKSRHERALVLGTGGASKAVEFVLEEIGLTVLFVSRNPKGNRQFSYSDVNLKMIEACGVIVNCTPLGMYPDINKKPEIPYGAINSEHLVVDLIYNPEETIFLQEAKKFGAMTLNGMVMLQQQAEKAWEIWNRD